MSWRDAQMKAVLVGEEKTHGPALNVAVTDLGGALLDLRGHRHEKIRDTLLERRAQGFKVVYIQPAAVAADEKAITDFDDVYDVRVVEHPADDGEALAEKVVARLSASPWFSSTRGYSLEGLDFLHVVKTGIAPDGGLFLPETLPSFSLADIQTMSALGYNAAAQLVLERFIAPQGNLRSLSPQELKHLIRSAYSLERWEAVDGDVCPVRKVGDGNTYVVELFHGPTAAFKDFALQLFPKFFSKSVARSTSQYVILAATSGDTGVAAISGFMNEGDVAVMVLYPKDGVSAVQKAQMLACDGGNVRVLGVDADFDFCQTTVKRIFNNIEYKGVLRGEANAVLSSANSINWGRLLPQVVYYIYAYANLVRQGAIKTGDAVDVVVPTGNFGNILSAYVAKLCGVPFRKFVCASNVNNVLTDFITTGTYRTKERGLTLTASPSIDILKSSNVERFLHLLSGGDAPLVKRLMEELDDVGHFTVPDDIREKMQAEFVGGYATEAECLATIKKTHETHGYLLDTHTAVGYKVLEDYKADLAAKGTEVVPIILAATASFAKFPDAVQEGLNGASAPSLKPYDVAATYADLEARTSSKVPRALSHVVAAQAKQTAPPRTCEKSEEVVMAELKAFCKELTGSA